MMVSQRKLDLTGQRFGALEVICPVESIGGKTRWRCRCDCGKETEARTDRLRSGRLKSCGCKAGVKALTMVDGTCVEMLRANHKLRKNNTSGVTGVYWLERDGGRWRATICFKGKRYILGQFKDFDEAVEARKKAEEQMFGAFLLEQSDRGKFEEGVSNASAGSSVQRSAGQ